MDFLADERVDGPIVARLRGDGYQVQYAAKMAPGTPDEIILEIANREGAVLLTTDKDFGELIFRQRRVSSGVILIRLSGLSAIEKASTLSNAIENYGGDFGEAFTVVTPKAIRIRRLEQ